MRNQIFKAQKKGPTEKPEKMAGEVRPKAGKHGVTAAKENISRRGW